MSNSPKKISNDEASNAYIAGLLVVGFYTKPHCKSTLACFFALILI